MAFTLALAYLSVGVYPGEIISAFLGESITATLPLVAHLLAVWIVYFVIYTLAAAPIHTFLVSIYNTEWYIKSSMTRCSPIFHFRPIAQLIRQITGGLSMDGRCREIPEHLATGWEASTHPQTE